MEAFLQRPDDRAAVPAAVRQHEVLELPRVPERRRVREPVFPQDPPRRQYTLLPNGPAPVRDPAPTAIPASVEHDLRWTLSAHDLDVVRDWFQRWRCCVRCGARYREADNLGQWRCRQHMRTVYDVNERHPLTGRAYEDAHGRSLWRCCERPLLGRQDPRASENGCVPADHTEHDTRYTDRWDLDVPLRLLEHVPVAPDAVVERRGLPADDEFAAGTEDDASVPIVRVRRYDFDTWQALQRRAATREHQYACARTNYGGMGFADVYGGGGGRAQWT